MGTGRVTGIGGIFFKSQDRAQLTSWYSKNLGIEQDKSTSMFKWQSLEAPGTEHLTVWSVFPASSSYFDPSTAPFMINYIVDNLDALLDKLLNNGVRIDPKREDHEYGRFAWIYDPDGNKIELWEPAKPS